MCPRCGMAQLMLMKRDWAAGNDISEHKRMTSGQQSVLEEADHFCVANSFSSPCHLHRMMLPIKECLPLWACNLMQIRPTVCQIERFEEVTQPSYLPVISWCVCVLLRFRSSFPTLNTDLSVFGCHFLMKSLHSNGFLLRLLRKWWEFDVCLFHQKLTMRLFTNVQC